MNMHALLRYAIAAFKHTLLDEQAQDLVEYTLTFAVLALGCVAGMTSVAQAIDQTFLALTNVLSSALQS